MPEISNDKTIFSILEVTNSIKKTLEKRYTNTYWIKTEMNKLNHYSHSGHCPDNADLQSVPSVI
ncbi:exodeoxyribonuclease VII large subunit [Flavobacterium succinicans]|uniref:Exodeoxyribonuclease VII large subunit n=1 Tax=Flavobacterium succinicans TaxID=29536 RepID=A0A1I4TMI9_9FLAO|nr:exodeoxyribonuclease VII large subunit [Flavobacterium succinicans]